MPEFFTKIVGVTFQNTDGSDRQEIIEDLEDQLRNQETVALQLQRDPQNPYDHNAIIVQDDQHRQIGFLRRTVSESIAPMMDNGIVIQCTLEQITGQSLAHNFGINIKISY